MVRRRLPPQSRWHRSGRPAAPAAPPHVRRAPQSSAQHRRLPPCARATGAGPVVPAPGGHGSHAGRSGAPGSSAGALRAPRADRPPPASARHRCGRHRSPVTRGSRTARQNCARSTRWSATRKKSRRVPRCPRPRDRQAMSLVGPRAAGSMHVGQKPRAARRGHIGPAHHWARPMSAHRAVVPAHRDHGRTPVQPARRPARIHNRPPHAVGSAPCGHCMDRCRMLSRSAGDDRTGPTWGQRCYHRIQSMPARPGSGVVRRPHHPHLLFLAIASIRAPEEYK